PGHEVGRGTLVYRCRFDPGGLLQLDHAHFAQRALHHGSRGVAELLVIERIADRCLDQPDMRAAIEARALETVRVYGLAFEQGGDRVGQLDLSTGTWRRVFQQVEDAAVEDVTADDRQRAWRDVGLG